MPASTPTDHIIQTVFAKTVIWRYIILKRSKKQTKNRTKKNHKQICNHKRNRHQSRSPWTKEKRNNFRNRPQFNTSKQVSINQVMETWRVHRKGSSNQTKKKETLLKLTRKKKKSEHFKNKLYYFKAFQSTTHAFGAICDIEQVTMTSTLGYFDHFKASRIRPLLKTILSFTASQDDLHLGSVWDHESARLLPHRKHYNIFVI